LAAEDALPARLRRPAAKQIQFERFEIEKIDQLLDGGGHAVPRRARPGPAAYFLAYGIGSAVKPGTSAPDWLI
jgi:hypothetical protein